MTQHSKIGEGVEVLRDSANSHCFDDRIMVAGECIAFASEPWSSKIAASLAREPATADVGREVLEAATKAASVAEVCAILATRYDSKGNAQIGNHQSPTAHRIAQAYEQHLVAIRGAVEALSRAAPSSVTLYRAIDALGGARNEDGEYNAGWSDGHSRALDDALEILTKRGFTEAADAGLTHGERVAYEERILALEMDVERLAKGQHPIYADAAKVEALARDVLRTDAHSRGPHIAAMHDDNALVNVGTAVSAMMALSRAAPSSEPVAWCSPGQLANLTDVDADGGVYLPIRKTKRGNFTMPLYAAPSSEPAIAGGEALGPLWRKVQQVHTDAMSHDWTVEAYRAGMIATLTHATTPPTTNDAIPACERCRRPSPQGIRCYACLAGEVEQLRFEADRNAAQSDPCQAISLLERLAAEEDAAIPLCDDPRDKGRCAIIAAEYRRVAKMLTNCHADAMAALSAAPSAPATEAGEGA